MKKTFYLNILLVLVMVFSVCLGSTSFVFAENSQETKITVTDFNETNWEQNLPIDTSSIDFVSEAKNYESTVSTTDTLTGSYSVEFSVGGLAGGNGASLQMVIALGAESVTEMPLNSSVAYMNANANTIYLGFSGTRIYIFDRNSGDGNPSYSDKEGGSGQTELGTFYWKHLYNYYSAKGIAMTKANFKVEIIESETADTLNIYVASSASFNSTPDCSVVLHKKDIADGYLQFSQNFVNYGTAINSQRIVNLKVNNELVSKNSLEVLGNVDLVTISNTRPTDSITIYDADYATSNVISNFAINDSSLSDGDEVFSLTYTGKRFATETDDHYWGLVFGVDKSGDLSTGTEIKFNRRGASNTTGGGVCVYHCTSSIGALPNVTISFTIKGYKGGRVEVTYNDYSTCPTHTAVYENVDLNGRVAFKIFNDSGLEGAYWNINSISMTAETKVVEYCTVTTIVNGAETPTSIEKGTAYIPETPVKEGEIFIGWYYADSDEQNVYKHTDFSIESVQEDITLTALFVDLDIVGAGIKVTGTTGLRFIAQISDESKALLESLNVQVNYGTLLSNADLGSLDVPCINWFNEEKTQFTAVLTDLEDSYATVNFTAKAYVEIDGVKYYSNEETRSIASIAYSAVNDYITSSEGEYIYELEEGKFYRVDYLEESLTYLNELASKHEA